VDAVLDRCALSRWSAVQLVRRNDLPGLVVVGLAVVLAFVIDRVMGVSPLVAGVVLGAVFANVGLLTPRFVPGVAFAALAAGAAFVAAVAIT